jgi:hypothetical protein
MTSTLEQHIREFWAWFSTIADFFGQNLQNGGILRELDNRVALFRGVTWEVGPGLMKPNALVISPNGDKDLLGLTTVIVQAAPETADWEFHCAKPAKSWNMQFRIHASDGSTVGIDATDWTYVLLEFPEGPFDLIVCAENLRDLASDTRQAALEIAVEGIIGEMARLQCIDAIDVVSELSDVDRRRSTLFKHLADHLNSLRHSGVQ